jgi:dihydroflavonol-4-reductase
MRALVTGGTGFVGSAVVRVLLRDGFRVSCLMRPTSDLRNLEGLDVRLVEGDLRDRDSLQKALEGCQQLYHVAAYYSTRPEDADKMMTINFGGSRNLLELAVERGLERIVHTSTIGTVGRPDGPRLPTEEDLYANYERASPYVLSKLKAEQLALDLGRRGAPVIVVNPCAPVGFRDVKPSSTGQRIIDYLRGRTPSFSPGGINFVSVNDVARGHLLAAERGRAGQRYILGNLKGNLMLEDFCHLVERASGTPPPGRGRLDSLKRIARQLKGLLRGSDPSSSLTGHRPTSLTADPARAVRELGMPQTPLEVDFVQAVHWFRIHGYV